MNDIKVMNHAADNIRILAASMVEKAKSGHPGGAMGGADFVNVLYSEYLQYDPENPTWEGRDRFFLDTTIRYINIDCFLVESRVACTSSQEFSCDCGTNTICVSLSEWT